MPNNIKNKIDDLRNHLFATIEALKDEEKPMDIKRAQAIADIARVLVDSAKVEVAFLNVTGGLQSTGFIPDGDGADPDGAGAHNSSKPRPALSAGRASH